jgi:hypothetical protein
MGSKKAPYKGQPCTLQVPPPVKAACSYTRKLHEVLYIWESYDDIK